MGQMKSKPSIDLTPDELDQAEKDFQFMRSCGQTHIPVRIDLFERIVAQLRIAKRMECSHD